MGHFYRTLYNASILTIGVLDKFMASPDVQLLVINVFMMCRNEKMRHATAVLSESYSAANSM